MVHKILGLRPPQPPFSLLAHPCPQPPVLKQAWGPCNVHLCSNYNVTALCIEEADGTYPYAIVLRLTWTGTTTTLENEVRGVWRVVVLAVVGAAGGARPPASRDVSWGLCSTSRTCCLPFCYAHSFATRNDFGGCTSHCVVSCGFCAPVLVGGLGGTIDTSLDRLDIT